MQSLSPQESQGSMSLTREVCGFLSPLPLTRLDWALQWWRSWNGASQKSEMEESHEEAPRYIWDQEAPGTAGRSCIPVPRAARASPLPLPRPRTLTQESWWEGRNESWNSLSPENSFCSPSKSFMPCQARRGCKTGGGTTEYRKHCPVAHSASNFPVLRVHRLPLEWKRCQGS